MLENDQHTSPVQKANLLFRKKQTNKQKTGSSSVGACADGCVTKNLSDWDYAVEQSAITILEDSAALVSKLVRSFHASLCLKSLFLKPPLKFYPQIRNANLEKQ